MSASLSVSPSLDGTIGAHVYPDVFPIHGLRHPPVGTTSGWYVWTGELLPDEDFFVTVCADHLISLRPEVAQHLALPPGSRFLLAPGYEDIWQDASLLEIDE